ncbi:MAG: SDR family NAD(P)-dependent oxidoreductase [Bacteroidales bacterium]|jgi:NADP-dependent 3-hydroxy acid dehydrogenase YdfG
MSLKDKRIIVVGASSGMGLATAKHLHGKGAHIIMVARNAERLKYAAKLV